MSEGLRKKTIDGVKWTTTSTIANSVMQLGYTSIMAHLLTPKAFGLIALSNVVLRFAGYFGNMGLSQSIIQKPELTKEDIRATFTSAIILALAITIIVWLLSPFIVELYDEPELLPILNVMVLSFIISSFSLTSLSMLRREMRFKEMAIMEVFSYVVGYMIVGISLAYNGYGVWSLIFATLTQTFLHTVISYLIIRHNLLLIFNWKYYKPLFAYGSKISFISLTEFIGGELDTMVIGKVLGSRMLGFYNRGFLLINLPIYFMTTSFSKVLFPSFSRIQADREKLKKVYLSSITIVAAVIIPVALGVSVAANEIVNVVLGSQWQESAIVLQVLPFGVALGFVAMFAGIVCDATASLSKKIVLTSSYIFILLFLFYIFSPLGLVGFAAAITVGQVIRTTMYMFLMRSILSVSFKSFISSYLPGIFNGLIVALTLLIFKQLLLPLELPLAALLVIEILLAGISFLIVTFLIPGSKLKNEIKEFLSKMDVNATSGAFNRLIFNYKNYISRR